MARWHSHAALHCSCVRFKHAKRQRRSLPAIQTSRTPKRNRLPVDQLHQQHTLPPPNYARSGFHRLVSVRRGEPRHVDYLRSLQYRCRWVSRACFPPLPPISDTRLTPFVSQLPRLVKRPRRPPTLPQSTRPVPSPDPRNQDVRTLLHRT
jgi:hypothetical protein